MGDKRGEKAKWLEIEHTDAQDSIYPVESPEWYLQQMFASMGIQVPSRTPARVVRAFKEMLQGYHQTLQEVCHVLFDANPDGYERTDMDIEVQVGFVSLCEHHLLPFEGVCRILYRPRDQLVLGASKLARIVNLYARRLQIQERLTQEIADAIVLLVNPYWVEVETVASHACMRCRGVNERNSHLRVRVVRGYREPGCSEQNEQ